MPTVVRLVCPIVSLALIAGPAGAAKRLEPPSRFLTAQENRVAVVQADEIADGSALFLRLAALHGETPAEIGVRLDETSVSRIRVGESYVIGYTGLRRDRRRAPVFETDGGPRIVQIAAVGPALFENSRPLRQLIRAVARGAEPVEEELLEPIVELLRRADPASRLLAAAELALRPELMLRSGAAQRAALRRALGSESRRWTVYTGRSQCFGAAY